MNFAHTFAHTPYKQSEGEPPELEEINDEYDIPQDGWDILDKAEPITEPTTNQAFITEGPTPDDEEQPPPDTSGTCEEIPLISAKHETSDSQEGLFSMRSTTKQPSPPPSSLIMGAPPSPSSLLKDHPSISSGFKPLIEVVSSTAEQTKETDDSEHSRPLHIIPTSNHHSTQTTSSTKSASLHHQESSKLGWSSLSGKTTTPPETTELVSGGQWAVSANVTKPEPVVQPASTLGSGGLLIQEIDDDDDFNIGHLPLTVEEQAAIAETDAALERIKNRPISELSEGERVWQLAASVGSTSTSVEGGDEGAELDEETKARLRERLTKSGLIDKTSLKF